jgi:hypothetical protein
MVWTAPPSLREDGHSEEGGGHLTASPEVAPTVKGTAVKSSLPQDTIAGHAPPMVLVSTESTPPAS